MIASGPSTSCGWNSNQANNGAHTISVTSYDMSGNKLDANSLSVAVSNIAPKVNTRRLLFRLQPRLRRLPLLRSADAGSNCCPDAVPTAVPTAVPSPYLRSRRLRPRFRQSRRPQRRHQRRHRQRRRRLLLLRRQLRQRRLRLRPPRRQPRHRHQRRRPRQQQPQRRLRRSHRRRLQRLQRLQQEQLRRLQRVPRRPLRRRPQLRPRRRPRPQPQPRLLLRPDRDGHTVERFLRVDHGQRPEQWKVADDRMAYHPACGQFDGFRRYGDGRARHL